MIDVVCFDLGNVLVHLRQSRGRERLLALLPRDAGSEATGAVTAFLEQNAAAYSAGDLTVEAFFGRLGDTLGTGSTADLLKEVWCDIFDPWPEMEAVAAEVIGTGVQTLLWSNTDPVHFAHLQARMPVLDRFDGFHLSYEVGHNKPDAAYFEAAIDRFDLTPARTVFVDDTASNIATAATMGFQTFQCHRDADAVRRYLCGHNILTR